MRGRLFLGAVLLGAFIPVSSALGLVRPMTEAEGQETDGGWNLFREVWAANFWGDMVFTLGTMAAAWAVAFLVRKALEAPPSGWNRWMAVALTIPASFLLHWTVYAFSWALTMPALIGDAGFYSWNFEMFYGESGLGASYRSGWSLTFDWGWPGLIFAGIVGPAAAAWFELGTRSDLRSEILKRHPTAEAP